MLRQLRLVRSSLTSDTAKTLVHAFVSSRIDYCNSMLYGVSDGLLKKLQAVQNAAAWVVTGARKFDHITPVLRDLHWLPVRQRIKYKLAMTVYRNACMDWRQLTWSTTVMQFPLSPASDIFGLQTWDIIRAKDDDNTGDEEFCGRRPTHLEQCASCPSNRNALASDVRPTSQEPPV